MVEQRPSLLLFFNLRSLNNNNNNNNNIPSAPHHHNTTMSIFHTLSPYPKTLPLYSTPFLKTLTLTLTPIQTPTRHHHHRRRTTVTTAKSTNTDSPDGPDRLISALCYFYPFFDGIQYGKYAINQFSFIQTLIQPLVPAIRVYKTVPFNGVLVFLTLYFVVVRNNNFSRYVRFNAMQAVVLDVLLIFPDLLERGFDPKDGVGLGLLMSVDSTVFLFMLVSLVYGSCCCCLGQLPRLPIVAEAADRQVM